MHLLPQTVPSPLGPGELHLPQLRRRPVLLPNEGHNDRVLALKDGLRAGQAASVKADEVPMLFLRPDGEHLVAALLVEPYVGVPESTAI